MNEHITQALRDYTNIKNPQYAVMLTGKWGCGKTYFIKKWIASYKMPKASGNKILLRPIYVSLYGLSSTAEINEIIDRELHPFFYSKTGKLVNGLVKFASKAIVRTEISLKDEDKKCETTFALDSLSLLKDDKDIFSGKKIIVFDDVERCLINKKKLLGYINYFVEHCGCNVIIICNENGLLTNDREQMDEFLEKTVGRQFELKADVDAALSSFLDDTSQCKPIADQKDWIKTCFEHTNYENLRVLKQCLYDFAVQLERFQLDDIKPHLSFFKTFLASFIVVYIELGQKKYRKYLQEWDDKLDFTTFIDEIQGENPEIRELYGKYENLGRLCSENPLNKRMVKPIVAYHTKGIDCTDFIKESTDNSEKEYSILEKLQNFMVLDNQKFEYLIKEVYQIIDRPEPNQEYTLGSLVGHLFTFHLRDIRNLTAQDFVTIEKLGLSLITSCQQSKQLYKTHRLFFQGLFSLQNNFSGSAHIQSIINKWRDEYDCCIKKLENDIQAIIRILNDDNVSQLAKIDKEPYVDNSTLYQDRAIFSSEDVGKVFNSVEKLTNAGRTEFTAFISSHYRNAKVFADHYKDDFNFLNQLNSLVTKKIESTHSVEKYSYISLNGVLAKILKSLN